MKYAENTAVDTEGSRAEIDRTLRRYGATGFMYGWMDARAMVTFEMHQRRVRFVLPLPDPKAPEFTHYRVNANSDATRPRTPEAAAKTYEQATRQRWRALALAIKAKLEAVDSGISQFEEEFMAQIVMANGQTIGEGILPQLNKVIDTGKFLPMLPAAGQGAAK